MVQNSLLVQRLMIHSPTSSGMSEWANERMSEASGAEQACGRCEGTDLGMAQYICRGFLVILDHSGAAESGLYEKEEEGRYEFDTV